MIFDLTIDDFLRHIREERKKAIYDVNDPSKDEKTMPLPGFVTVQRLERILFDPTCNRTFESPEGSMKCCNDYPSNYRKIWRTIMLHAAIHPLGLPITIPITWEEIDPFQSDELIVTHYVTDGSRYERHLKIIPSGQSEGGFVTARIAPDIVKLYRAK